MEKRQKQKELRDMLLSAAEDKKQHLNEEKQNELALEMKILEKALQEPQEDPEEKTKRKVRAEGSQYLTYSNSLILRKGLKSLLAGYICKTTC